jgi:hypothetical protein
MNNTRINGYIENKDNNKKRVTKQKENRQNMNSLIKKTG